MQLSSPASLTASKTTCESKWNFKNIFATLLFAPYFFILLLAFHPIHLIASMMSYQAKEWTLLTMNKCFLWGLKVLAGCKVSCIGDVKEVSNQPIIIVSNHQSMYDITLLLTLLNKGDIRFVAKKELARWIPSISLALKNMEAALIERKNRAQSLQVIKQMALRAGQLRKSICIFPEGTRSRDGKLLPLKRLGLAAILNEAPNLPIMPVTIKGTSKILKYGFWPVTYGASVELKFHPLIEPSKANDLTKNQIIDRAFDVIQTEFSN